VRPRLTGTISIFDFHLLPDFAGGTLSIQDAWIDVHQNDWIRLRVGKQKSPVGLERLQGETHFLFLERALPTNLVPNRDIGALLHGDIGRGVLTYTLGIMNGVPDGASSDADFNDQKDFEGRIFVQPFLATALAVRGLGVGVSGTYGHRTGTAASSGVAPYVSGGQNTFFSYMSSATGDSVLASGTQQRLSPQGYFYAGPVGLLAEMVWSSQELAKGAIHGTVVNKAWQVSGSIVLTGEPASFYGVNPEHPFDLDRGDFGAFDVSLRWNVLEIDPAAFQLAFADASKSANEARAGAIGLNWYLNQNLRYELDFERTWFKRGGPAGTDRPIENFLGTRLQVAF
jgi:phosphate-selective porin OprO/OprP